MLELNIWDVVLLVAVSLMSTVLAYVRSPRVKALVFGLPIPFTLAALSLNQEVDATYAMGLLMLLVYVHGVRVLHRMCRWPIALAIVVSALGIGLFSAGLARVLPASDYVFWLSLLSAVLLAVTLFVLVPRRFEPSHRTSMPLWAKLPVILGVVFVLIALKQILRGFMPLFPMVGLIAAYEARHSLWTLCGQVPIFILL
jgi:hypothetical protein